MDYSSIITPIQSAIEYLMVFISKLYESGKG